jgi:poly(3-hydroxybutyrate) depolymerase
MVTPHPLDQADAPQAARLAGPEQPRRRALGIESVARGGGQIPIVTRDVEATPFWTLVELAPPAGMPLGDVLVVPPLSGHFPMLLRDLIVGLLPAFRVRVIDWTNVRHVPLSEGRFGFDDNVLAVERAIAGLPPGAGVVALCQGGVPAVAATARVAAAGTAPPPAALAVLAAPVDPLAAPTGVVRLIRQRPPAWFGAGPIAPVAARHAGRGRPVYPAELQGRALDAYLARHLDGESELARKLEHDDGADPERFPFLDLYTSVMDIDARHFAENIQRVFHDRTLARGTMRVAGAPVRPQAIRDTALLTLEGERDDIAAPGQTQALMRLCPGVPEPCRAAAVIPGAGHFSLFHGDLFRAAVLPRLAGFLRRRMPGADDPGD